MCFAVRSLAADPASRDLRNKDGWQPLHQAAYRRAAAGAASRLRRAERGAAAGSQAAVAALRARPSALTPRRARRSGEVEVLQALLKAGAKANARDKDGDTPVHYAAAQGHLACIKALAAAPGGCDLEAVDNDGETPMDVAERCVAASVAHAPRADARLSGAARA